MNMIYNSASFCVVEFKGDEGQFAGGFEIVDKLGRREIFIEGSLAQKFAVSVKQLIEGDPSIEEVDEFLRQFEGIMLQPLVLH
jgi:hypothetical protein